MTMDIRAERRAEALIDASEGNLYVVALGETENDPLYVENPEEQGLKDDQPQDYLVRVFACRTDADRFRESIKVLYPFDFPVKMFSGFEALWPELQDANRLYIKHLGLPVRAVLCSMAADEHPKELETVFPPPAFKN